jgi:hypothetical protein
MVLAMSINRRELLSGLAVTSVAAAVRGLGFSEGAAPGLRINPDRLRESLEGLSVYGRPEGGTFAGGVARTGFSDACVAGRNYAMLLMRGFSLEPRVDPAGDIFGSRSGSDERLKPILFGPHIDSVPSGGNFDGDLGSMASIEVIRTLKEHGVTTRHPLQMAICQHSQARPYATWLHVGMEHLDHNLYAPGHGSREQSLLPAHLPQLARCAGLTHRATTAHDAALQHHYYGKLR